MNFQNNENSGFSGGGGVINHDSGQEKYKGTCAQHVLHSFLISFYPFLAGTLHVRNFTISSGLGSEAVCLAGGGRAAWQV